FFHGESGIRDFHVSGVQTCALPISSRSPAPATVTLRGAPKVKRWVRAVWRGNEPAGGGGAGTAASPSEPRRASGGTSGPPPSPAIGRASWRGRGLCALGAASVRPVR